MVFTNPGRPLALVEVAIPEPDENQLLIRVGACAVCRTDLHIIDGELANPKRPLVPGHEIVGVVTGKGARAERFSVGDRVGVPWLGWTCGVCPFCRSRRENLCSRPVSPAIRSTAASPNSRSRISASVLRYPSGIRTWRRRRFSVPASSAIARCGRQATGSG